MAGPHLPVQPMEHHYLITDDIPEIAAWMALGWTLPAPPACPDTLGRVVHAARAARPS